jgi:hypothetical protein
MKIRYGILLGRHCFYVQSYNQSVLFILQPSELIPNYAEVAIPSVDFVCGYSC